MDDDTMLTAFERRVAADLDQYTRGIIDTRPTSTVARQAVRGRPRARRWWSSRGGRLILVAAMVATAAVGVIGVGGSRPSVAVLPSPSPTPAGVTAVPYPLAGSLGLALYQLANHDDSASAIHLVGLDGSNDRVVAMDVNDPRHEQPEWTPDGNGITFLVSARPADGRDIWRYDLTSSTSRLLIACDVPCADQETVAMSPDQTRLIAFHAEGPIEEVVVDGDTTAIPTRCSLRITSLLDVPAAPVDLKPTTCGLVEYLHPRWSPTADRVAAIRFSRDIRGGQVINTELVVVDVATGSETVAATRPGDALSGVDWSPDGLWIVITDGSSLARIHPDATGLETLVQAGGDAAHNPRYLASGSQITFVRTTVAEANRANVAKGSVVDVSPWIVDVNGGEPVKVLPYGTFTNWMSIQPTP